MYTIIRQINSYFNCSSIKDGHHNGNFSNDFGHKFKGGHRSEIQGNASCYSIF